MAGLVKQFKVDTGCIALSRKLIRGLPPQNTPGAGALYITALQHFVRDNIQYVNDTEGVEQVQWPSKTLEWGTGDCDDKAVLVNTLCACVGYSTLFYAIGLNGGPFQHVLGGVKLGTRHIPLETIVPHVEPGWMPPNAGPVMPWNV